VKYILVDEISMISSFLMQALDQRLRELYPEHRDKFCGNVSVIVFGDYLQLPPICTHKLDKPLFLLNRNSLAFKLMS
jgi:hypothetical protein